MIGLQLLELVARRSIVFIPNVQDCLTQNMADLARCVLC